MAHFYYHHQQAPPSSSDLPSMSSHHRPRRRAQSAPVPAPAAAPPPRRQRASHPKVRGPPAPAPVIDPLIAFHNRPTLEFDVSLSPAHIMLAQSSSSSSFANLTPRHLAAPAVVPPVPYLRITCALFRWTIDVYPATHGGVVSVGDVIEAIYRSLRQLVSRSEWDSASPEMQLAVRTAYKRRCRRQHSHTERVYEETRGLRRVDWLMKNTMFQGLRPGNSPDHWEMHLRPGEKSVKFALRT